MTNDNFNKQTRVDHPILPQHPELCGADDRGSFAARLTGGSGRFTIRRRASPD